MNDQYPVGSHGLLRRIYTQARAFRYALRLLNVAMSRVVRHLEESGICRPEWIAKPRLDRPFLKSLNFV